MRIVRLVVLAILAASPVAAQQVRGVLVDAAGKPVSGAFISLRGEGGAVVARALTGADGRFSVQGRTAGSYRVRAERIGFGATNSPALALAAGESRELQLVSAGAPVALEGLVAQGRSSCDVRRADGRAAALLWEEARKAIDATTWTSGTMRFGFTEYVRDIEAETERITTETSQRLSASGRSVWRSRDPAELTRVGYREVRGDGIHFFAPDAALLLSDEFQDTHCFGMRRGEGPTAGLVGLTFEPSGRRDVTDVSGVLWLDPATSELRHLDFRFTGLPREEEHEGVGGRVEFARLAGGAWIVRRWRLRMPQLVAKTWNATTWRGSNVVLQALRETGGYVQDVSTEAGERVFAAESGTLEGVVSDAVTAAPLAGARVALVGTQRTAMTDGEGRFRIAGLGEGRYSVTFTHPRTDSLRYRVPATDVTVRTGAASSVRLLSPSLATVIAAGCDSLAAGAGVLAGAVINKGSRVPIPDASVTVWWNGSAGPVRGEVRSDTEGNYRFCAAPVGVPITARASLHGKPGDPVTLTLDGTAPVLRDLAVVVYAQIVQVEGVTLRATGSPDVAVHGLIVDAASGDPVQGVTVRLEGAAPRTTNRRGMFVTGRVRQGTHRVEIEHPRYGMQTRWIAVGGGQVYVTFEIARPEP
jgi:hypothetical protein